MTALKWPMLISLALSATSIVGCGSALTPSDSKVAQDSRNAATPSYSDPQSMEVNSNAIKLSQYLGYEVSGNELIAVRRALGIDRYYDGLALEVVGIEFSTPYRARLQLLLDGQPFGWPELVDRFSEQKIRFRLPQGQDILGRDFRRVEIEIQGFGFVGEVFARLDQPRDRGPYPIAPNH